jgi:hypothetical protein
VVQNVGSDVRGGTLARAPLPRTSRLGFTLNIVDPQGTPRLLLVTEWVSPSAADDYWLVGLEGGVVRDGVGLLGRIGLTTERRATDLRNPTFGGGLVYHNLRLDYAYQGLSALGDGLHRFTIGWVW